MRSKLQIVSILVILWQPTLSFYNLCETPKNVILNDDECHDLYFEANDKASSLGEVEVELDENVIKITPKADAWTTSYLRISSSANSSNSFCSKLTKAETQTSYCFQFSSEYINETFQLEYKVEQLPEINTRRFLFNLPDWKEVPIFLYIDQTDLSQLILKAQVLPNNLNISYYKVEAYKERSSNTNLQDFQIYKHNEDINYKLFTYNDVGNYFFVVGLLNENCTSNVCLKVKTPKVFIGRKGTRVVIGIVGASFILPFILFVFHILTKKYPEDNSKTDDKLIVAYKSSSKKHNELVTILAALLEKLTKTSIEIVDLSKTNTKKFTHKICIDSLLYANRIVYVAPPKHDVNPIEISKSLSEKNFYVLIFDHCSDKLPNFFDSKKVFKFDDFTEFLGALNITGPYNIGLYRDLVKKTEEAIVETENMETLPKIVVTESEPQENDSLISQKVIL